MASMWPNVYIFGETKESLHQSLFFFANCSTQFSDSWKVFLKMFWNMKLQFRSEKRPCKIFFGRQLDTIVNVDISVRVEKVKTISVTTYQQYFTRYSQNHVFLACHTPFEETSVKTLGLTKTVYMYCLQRCAIFGQNFGSFLLFQKPGFYNIHFLFLGNKILNITVVIVYCLLF